MRATLLATALCTGVLAMPGRLTASQKEIKRRQDLISSLQATSVSSAVSMSTLRQMKESQFAQNRADGLYDEDRYEIQAATKCVNGKAGEYSCNKVDLLGQLRHQDMGGKTGFGNDVWGWTSSTGREFALVGQEDGTAFVEVFSDGSLSYLGRLPTQTVNSSWRDIKVIGDYAYIGAESSNHGLQIFDLKKLLTLNPASPQTFALSSLTARFSAFGSSHNIVANPDTNMIYAVGTSSSLSCRGGLWMIDVSNPASPKDKGCVSQDGYVHDAQCVIYNGPTEKYRGKEICFNYNEDALTIVQVERGTTKLQISSTSYNGASYTHQGWVVDDSHTFVLLDDELDEQNKKGQASNQRTTTYIVDIRNLEKPVFTGVYQSPVKSIDHNQYVVNGLSYQANYASGLRIVDVSSVSKDSSGAGFKEVGNFDVHPSDDASGGAATFNGAWSVYPYLKSGVLLVNSIERGLFALKYTG